jgi:protein-S-isoprenylcysteine O-methyltransferase Ste14
MAGIEDQILLNALWVVWCVFHSVLISHAIIDLMKRKLGELFTYYRIIFVLVSIGTLLPLFFFQVSLPHSVLFNWHESWQYLRIAMILYAGMCIIGGFWAYDVQYVIGIRQIRLYMVRSSEPLHSMETKGILRYVRHPWYAAGLMLVWAGGTITDVNVSVRIILSVYLIVGTYLEERKLLVEIGEPYEKYREEVPMYFPVGIFSGARKK